MMGSEEGVLGTCTTTGQGRRETDTFPQNQVEPVRVEQTILMAGKEQRQRREVTREARTTKQNRKCTLGTSSHRTGNNKHRNINDRLEQKKSHAQTELN